MKKAISAGSRPGRSCSTSHSAMRACCRLKPMPGRARFPACSPLGTVEPPILEFANARRLESDKPWSAQRMPLVMDRVRNRLGQLSPRLGEADWLDGAFSAGDLMMVSVLQAESIGIAGRISESLRRCDLRWPAAKRGPPTSGPSTRNWRRSLASRFN